MYTPLRGEQSLYINNIPRFDSQGILKNIVKLQKSFAERHWHYAPGFSLMNDKAFGTIISIHAHSRDTMRKSLED